MSRPGDWNCMSCSHLNFQRRESCQRCGDSRSVGDDFAGAFRGGGGGFGFTTSSDFRPGDWYCTVGNCGTHNFSSRFCCFKCGALKDGSACGQGMSDGEAMRCRVSGGWNGKPNWKSGDWICPRLDCNEHNFASRMECFRCRAPRDFSNTTSY